MNPSPSEDPVLRQLSRLRWQGACLSARPDRSSLLELSPEWPLRGFRVRVHRNHAFEFVQPPAQTFLAFAGLEADWILTDYDDSLSFAAVEADTKADVELLWLDFDRYAMAADALGEWLQERLRALRQLSEAPFLLTAPRAHSGDALVEAVARAAESVPGIHVLPLASVEDALGERFLDLARASFQGTRYSRQAQLLLAQWLGLRWLPAAVTPRLKALAIDLDNTLYRGVLGEDGPAGLELTAGHKTLQEALVRLGEEGVLLAVVSKNEQADVERMFAVRQDFPLRPEHLAGMRANWNPKADNIVELAGQFNIAPSAFALLDDNPGELFAVAEAIPGLSILHASDDAGLTTEHLARFPRLMSFGRDETDALRAADIRAAVARKATAAPRDPVDYLVALDTQLHFEVRPRDRFKRICELPQKTNQFNLALRRLREGDVAKFVEEADRCVVTFDLKDKLSNSGNVGAVYVRAQEDVLVVEELCVSCRALGRSIEDIMIGTAIALGARVIGRTFSDLEFTYRVGPHNAPALSWLMRIAAQEESVEDEPAEDSPLRTLRVPFATLESLLSLRARLPESFVSVSL